MKYYHWCGHVVWIDTHNSAKTRVHNRHFAFYRSSAQNPGEVIYGCPNCGANLRVAYAYGDLRRWDELAPDIGKALRAWQRQRRKLAAEGKQAPRDPDRVCSYGTPYLLPRSAEERPPEPEVR